MPRSPTGMVKVNFYFDPKVMQALKWLAAKRSTNVSELVRKALREYAVSALAAEQAATTTLGTLDAESDA